MNRKRHALTRAHDSGGAAIPRLVVTLEVMEMTTRAARRRRLYGPTFVAHSRSSHPAVALPGPLFTSPHMSVPTMKHDRLS